MFIFFDLNHFGEVPEVFWRELQIVVEEMKKFLLLEEDFTHVLRLGRHEEILGLDLSL